MWSIFQFILFIFLFRPVQLEILLFSEAEVRYSTAEKISRSELKHVKSLNENLPPDVVSIDFYATEGFTVLPKDGISNFKNLEQVGLINCGINSILPGAFQNVPNLKVIKLQDNNLTSIPSGVFNNLNLVKLFLHRNFIASIASNAFDNMPKLRILKLNNNYIQNWESGWFRNCPNLVHVFIRRNEIKSLPENALGNLNDRTGLKVFLSKNAISEIHPTAFKSLKSVEELWLDRNKIKNLPEKLFDNIENIKVLVLSKNRLKAIHKNQFPKLQSMKILDLTKNNLICIPYEALAKVKHVFLKKNKMDCECIKNLRVKLSDNEKNKVLFQKC